MEPPHISTTIPLHHNTSALLHSRTTALQHYSTSAPRHFNTLALSNFGTIKIPMTNTSRITQNIPNFLTLLNLCSGFVSIVFVLQGNLEAAALLIIIAAVFDFFDGTAARMLKATSEKGKILDSLSDVVSFGVAPATLIFLMIEFSLLQKNPDFSLNNASFSELLFLFSPIIFVSSSAWRLAEFTVQKETMIFNGLPTPPASLFFAGLALIISGPDYSRISDFLLKPYFMVPACLLISFMMVSKIRFVSFKFKEPGFRKNFIQFLLILISIIMLVLLKKFAISPIIVIYIILSFIIHLIKKPSVL
jgi:CDP-diacylglycerol--serine O-phosphatidyltransferase